jgi:outer membrane protein assembly factor BamB
MSNWPQAAGPKGNWQTTGKAPVSWSVAEGKGVVWKTALPETGQSGIAVWGDRLYLTTMAVQAENNAKKEGGSIVGHCVDAKSGKTLWSVELKAAEPSPYAYGFSDSSSPTPVTDGKRVWFTNSSGQLACCEASSGKVLWRREWKPTTGRPFNKQFEPILDNGILLSCEPRDLGDPLRERDPWNYLKGLDAATGKVLWVAEDALTHYNTPVIGKLDGVPCVLQGRGGHHDVPEKPTGLSLTRLTDGKTIWRTELTGKALYNMHWDEKVAVWIDEDKSELTVLESKTGKILRTIPLDQSVSLRTWDGGKYVTEMDVNLKQRRVKVFPAWFTNILIDGYCWFLCFSNPQPAYGQGPTGPLYCAGRVHLASGRVEYLELPTAPGGVYKKPVAASTVNSQSRDIAQDPRSKRDGWHWVFIGSPIAVDGKIYYTIQNGVTYVLNGKTKPMDERAILAVNDLGPLGQTWSLNTPTAVNGKLYHRTMKELICLG